MILAEWDRIIIIIKKKKIAAEMLECPGCLDPLEFAYLDSFPIFKFVQLTVQSPCERLSVGPLKIMDAVTGLKTVPVCESLMI